MNKYEILINDSALNRTPGSTQILYAEGDRNDLMKELNARYVDCTEDEDENIISFEDWAEIYEAEADYGGSAVVVQITENDELIFRNSDYLELGYNEAEV